jgi:hypothetical protein
MFRWFANSCANIAGTPHRKTTVFKLLVVGKWAVQISGGLRGGGGADVVTKFWENTSVCLRFLSGMDDEFVIKYA